MLAGEPRARALAFSLPALSVAGAAGPALRFLLVTAGLPINGAMCPPIEIAGTSPAMTLKECQWTLLGANNARRRPRWLVGLAALLSHIDPGLALPRVQRGYVGI